MTVEFKPAAIPADLRRLHSFDRKVFPAADVFPPSSWREYESWWMLVGGRTVGCCAFLRNVEFLEDIRPGDNNPSRPGTLYIASTGIHPSHRGRGLGRLMKSWQIAYATSEGFRRILTTTRSRNRAMIALNLSMGFRVLRKTRGYYSNPSDSAIIMERKL